MRKSTLVTILALVGIAAIVIPLFIFLGNGGGGTDISTAPTDGMDFSFDDSDIAASFDESNVVSIIQGATISPSTSEDESTESSSATTEESSEANDNSHKPVDSSKTEDSYEVELPSAPEDSSALPVESAPINITTAGTHVLKGSFTNRLVTVEVAATEKVQLVLNGVQFNNQGPVIFIKSADKVTITAMEGTKNVLNDGSSYSLTSGTTNVDAAIFSLADLTVNGAGALTVNGNNQHGIVSKDRVVVSECTLNITAKGTGLNGKDYVKIKDGNINVTAGDDGISSDNAEDAAKGYVYIEGGSINVTAAHDGIQAETVLKSDVANITVTSGGGGNVALGTDGAESFKGLKAVSDILISGGTYTISSRDDCVHSNGTIKITGGTLSLSSGNDAMHANSGIGIEGGTIKIANCFEGMDASVVNISSGDISITSSDDGIMSVSAFTLSGGTLYINSEGDGIDSNGTLQIRGGAMVISGPSTGLDSAIDCAGSSIINGGVVVALSNASYAQPIGNSPSQGMAFCKFSEQAANTLLTLRDAEGKAIVAFKAPKAYSAAVISAPGIKKGNSYSLMAGGSIEGLNAFGFAENTACTDGAVIMNINMTSNKFQGSSN